MVAKTLITENFGEKTKNKSGASAISLLPPNQCSRAISCYQKSHMLVSVHNNGEVSIYQLPELVKKYTNKIFND